MNKSITALLKVNLSQSFDFRKKDKVKNASMLIPLILIFFSGSLLSGIYSFLFCFVLGERGEPSYNLVLYAIAGFSAMLTIVTGITKVKGTLFGGNDYDMLAALPIPKKNIIFVKLFSLYLVQLFYSTIFIFPATIIVVAFSKNLVWLLEGILLLILSPVIPLLISGILGTLIGFISDRFRFGNIISILFYIVFLGAIMYASFVLNTGKGGEEYDPTAIITLLNAMAWINPTTKLFSLDFLILPQVLYVVCNGVVLVGLILIFAKCYDYFHFLMTAAKTHQTYVEKPSKQKGQFKALFQLDLKRYFSSKMYLLNTITGGILCVLCTIVMIVSFTTVKDPEALTILKEISPYFVLLIAWCVGMSVPSASAVNMEGKTFWQIKTLPIPYKQYAKSKLLLSYVVLAPFVLIASSILTVYIEKTVIYILTTFILPQLYLFSMCCIGFFVNTYFYKLKWSNETEAVKNSAGSLISMLIDFVYTICLCMAFIIPGFFGYFIIGAILAFVVILAVAILFYILIQQTCEKNLHCIEC